MTKLYQNLFDNLNQINIISENDLIKNEKIDIQLNDLVILYNNGKFWNIVPLTILKMYPLIHGEYFDYDDYNFIVKKITIYVCPYTLFSCVYFEEFLPYTQVYNNNLILINKNKQIYIPILNKYISGDLLVDKYMRINEVKLMTFSNAIKLYPDCQFNDILQSKLIYPLTCSDYLTNNIILFKHKKFSNLHHCKKLIYIIEYKSCKQNNYKYTILLPKENSYDIKKNGFIKYFNKMIDKIRNKGGIIYPCLWFAWNAFYPISKIINL